MSVVGDDIDRAAWKRLTSPKDGCGMTGCTRRPCVSLTLSARELTGDKGGGTLATESIRYCGEHAEQRMVAALKGMRG